MRRVFHGLGSPKIRLLLGLVLVTLVMAVILAGGGMKAKATSQPALDSYDRNGSISTRIQALLTGGPQTQPEAGAPTAPSAAANPTGRHIEFLKYCLNNYQKSYHQYSCRLEKQELLGGKMTPVQVIDIKFKESPFSVLMVWQENAARGDKMLYVEDPAVAPDDWRMFIHPSGIAGRLLRFVEKRPDDPEVLRSSLRSIKEFGFQRGLQSLIAVYQQAQDAGHLTESYLGTGTVDGRPTVVLRRILPPGFDYPSRETIIEIDQEYLVPVRVRGTNFQNQPQCDYVYKNIRFNDDADVKASSFTRKANDLD